MTNWFVQHHPQEIIKNTAKYLCTEHDQSTTPSEVITSLKT